MCDFWISIFHLAFITVMLFSSSLWNESVCVCLKWSTAESFVNEHTTVISSWYIKKVTGFGTYKDEPITGRKESKSTAAALVLVRVWAHDRPIRCGDGMEEEAGRDPRGNMRSMSQPFLHAGYCAHRPPLCRPRLLTSLRLHHRSPTPHSAPHPPTPIKANRCGWKQ